MEFKCSKIKIKFVEPYFQVVYFCIVVGLFYNSKTLTDLVVNFYIELFVSCSSYFPQIFCFDGQV